MYKIYIYIYIYTSIKNYKESGYMHDMELQNILY